MSGRARRAPRAVVPPDVTRARDLGWAALATAVVASVGLALAARLPEAASPGPLARSHAAVACASCHGDVPARASCGGCHDAGAHVSTRAGHRQLAARGELACANCHPAHGAAEGVSFVAAPPARRGDPTTNFVRWGPGGAREGALAGGAAPAGATVSLVPLATCGGCHALEDARDPIASCAKAGSRFTTCQDEHQRGGAPPAPAPRGVCAGQHGATRHVAWSAARLVAIDAPPPARTAPVLFTSLAGAAAACCALVLAPAWRRRRLRRVASASLAALPVVPVMAAPPPPGAPPLDAPPDAPRALRVLPQIDATTCLGCYACVDACAFDVLEIERYVARVARPSDCCGAVTCEAACPNGSLRLTAGPIAEDRPRVDRFLESVDVPGLYVAGDLTGMPLIKNALLQGVRAMRRIAETLPRGAAGRARRAAGVLDVAIVGAGPAGLAAALEAKARGLSYVVLEQATTAASIKSFPRDKIVHDPPLDLPLEGELRLSECTKEELVAEWSRVVRAHQLDVREHHRVTDVARHPDHFAITADGPTGRARARAARVLLAIGRRGTPRTLAAVVQPDAEARVSYALADARAYAGRRVLVVGLGDAALEAIAALARQPGAHVTVSYRGPTFARGKARNVAEVSALAQEGRVRVVWSSQIRSVGPAAVILATPAGDEIIACDAVLALLGGAPSWDLLERVGLRRPNRSSASSVRT